MDAYTIARYTIADLFLDEDGEPLAGYDTMLDEAIDAALDACRAAGLDLDKSYTSVVEAAELLLRGDLR